MEVGPSAEKMKADAEAKGWKLTDVQLAGRDRQVVQVRRVSLISHQRAYIDVSTSVCVLDTLEGLKLS